MSLVCSTEDGALDEGWNDRRRAERYADAGHRTWNARRSLSLGRSDRTGAVASLLAISGTLDAILCPKPLSQ